MNKQNSIYWNLAAFILIFIGLGASIYLRRWKLVMRKLIYSLLIGIVLAGCGEDNMVEEQPEITQTEAVDGTPFRVITWEKDGTSMVLLPAGSFEMGDHFGEGAADELPVHQVELDAFYMDRYEVTIGQYKRFLKETASGTLPDQTPNWIAEKAIVLAQKGVQQLVGFTTPTDNHPVVGVTFNNAEAYAQWAGKRLPTEAEWEYAARGGLVGKRYVWGNQPPAGTDCNFTGSFVGEQADDGYLYIAPVGSYDANGYGLYDMAGNVWEWCADWYSDNYYAGSASDNPKGPEAGTERVLRGSGWSSYLQHLRLSRRLKLSPTATGFPQTVEYSGLKKPVLDKNIPIEKKKHNQEQKPQANPGLKKQVPDNIVWVGFRCVADLIIEE